MSTSEKDIIVTIMVEIAHGKLPSESGKLKGKQPLMFEINVWIFPMNKTQT